MHTESLNRAMTALIQAATKVMMKKRKVRIHSSRVNGELLIATSWGLYLI